MAYNLVTEAEVKEMVALHAAGQSSNDIGRSLGRDGRLVRTHLSIAGVLRTRTDAVRQAVRNGKIVSAGKGLRRDFFNKWSSEMAWVLGLIFGDGHVESRPDLGTYKITLAGTQDVTEKVAALVNPALHARKHSKHNLYILDVCSRELIESLRQYGLMGGNKARTIRLPAVPEQFLGDFLRGYWDADGSWTVRGRSLSTKIGSVSERTIDDLQSVVGGRKNVQHTVLKGRTFTSFLLTLRVEETARLVSKIYQNSTERSRCLRKYTQTHTIGGAAT
jgi:DNA-binding CsgD family transcriptional regulator